MAEVDRVCLTLAVAGALIACSRPPAGDDLDAPFASHDLPPELVEISALVAVDAHTVACVEDERGIVYSIDLRSGAVVARRPFGPDGDYEGLARVGDTWWVLRSDGTLLRLQQEHDALVIAHSIELDVGHDDFEGLAWDPFDEVLLVAAKAAPDGGKEQRGVRRVFAVDPARGAAAARIVLSVSVDRIVADARALGTRLPSGWTAKGRQRVDDQLRFSAIAVHPTTGAYYLLSAVDHALVVFDRQGALLEVRVFDAAQLPQAEGIALLESGDLVVASEGVQGPGRIQVFRYRPGEATPSRARIEFGDDR